MIAPRPLPAPVTAARRETPRPVRRLRAVLWLYLVLLVFEGVLRKWAFPGQSAELLLVRDPLVLAAYFLAGRAGYHRFVVPLLVCLGSSLVCGLVGLSAAAPLPVVIYGVRTDFLLVPLMWVVAEAWDEATLQGIARFFFLTSMAMALLMVFQFAAPAEAWINAVTGGEGLGQPGVWGKVRPSGFFAAATGPVFMLPLTAALAFSLLLDPRRRFKQLAVMAIFCVTIATAVSISRTLVYSIAPPFVVFLVVGATRHQLGPRALAAFGLMALLAATLLAIPVAREGLQAMTARFDDADRIEGGAVVRAESVFGGFWERLDSAPSRGIGIGMATNAASYYLHRDLGFELAEYEWDRAVVELGPILGPLYILGRIALGVFLGVVALRALGAGRELPMLVYAGTWHVFFVGQWAPPTVLGFAVLCGGLILAQGPRSPRPVPAARIAARAVHPWPRARLARGRARTR